MISRFGILLGFIFSFSLALGGDFALVYEKDGQAYAIVGVEESKPYYLEDGEKRFLTLVGDLRLVGDSSANPADLFYPLKINIEKLASERFL